MEMLNVLIPQVGFDVGTGEGITVGVEYFNHHVDEMSATVDKLEQKLNEVEQFYLSTNKKHPNTSRGSSIVKDKDKEKLVASLKKRQNDASKREAASTKRMQELMRQLGIILRQAITNALMLPDLVPPKQDAGRGYLGTVQPLALFAPSVPCRIHPYSCLVQLEPFTLDGVIDPTARIQSLSSVSPHWLKTLGKITQHRWANPFRKPVAVEALGLHDYYEVIDKPMDFQTITNKMEAKDGTGYKNVREICADVRLIFKNAMKYNDERNDVHVMAKTLLAKFEEKWLLLLPKVDEEEKRQKEEEAEAQLDMQLAQEAAHAKMARDLCNELDEVDIALEELRESLLQRCRRMSIEEKKRLGTALTQLSPEDLNKALLIVAQNNPSFQATAEEVDLDMDAQSESTLWKLKFFVKDALEVQGKSVAITGGNNHNHSNAHNNNKRKREICDALAKTSQKKGKKLPS